MNADRGGGRTIEIRNNEGMKDDDDDPRKKKGKSKQKNKGKNKEFRRNCITCTEYYAVN